MKSNFKKHSGNFTATVDVGNLFYKKLNTLLPYALSVYLSKKRFACVSGGRSSTKTTMCGADISIKRALDPNLAGSTHLCCREFGTSLKLTTWNTVRLLIEKEGLTKLFEFRKTDKMMIAKSTNSILWFTGLQNVEDIKSTSNIATLWIDEAETMTIDNLDILVPTVRGDHFNPRKYNTKIIFTFNPMSPIDEVREFCEKHSEDCEFRHINIFDLPPQYQNPIMLAEAEADRKANIEYFNWKWLGKPHPRMANQPFANCIVTNEIVFNRSLPCFAFLDPSFKGIDTTALTIMQANEWGGMNVVGFCWKLSWKDAGDFVVEKLKEYFVTDFFYESNSLGEIVEFHFNEYYGVHAEPHVNSTNKVNRIYDSAFHADILRFLRIGSCPENIVYLEQIKKYNMKVSTHPKLNQHDDAPDSLASLLIMLRKLG